MNIYDFLNTIKSILTDIFIMVEKFINPKLKDEKIYCLFNK